MFEVTHFWVARATLMAVHRSGPPSPANYGWLSAWYLVPVGLVILFILISLAVAAALDGSGAPSTSAAAEAKERKLPPYWTVHTDQTYSVIAHRTGLTVDQLERFNPYTDPSNLVPGEHIKLRLHVPKAPPKPKGPRYWTVRSGETFASIAAKTGHAPSWLQDLNKRLNPVALQPGQRVRLRR
jgi:LysM repeat protein